jgi:hypothetical protein
MVETVRLTLITSKYFCKFCYISQLKESDTIFKIASATSVCDVALCKVVETACFLEPVNRRSGVVLHLSEDPPNLGNIL